LKAEHHHLVGKILTELADIEATRAVLFQDIECAPPNLDIYTKKFWGNEPRDVCCRVSYAFRRDIADFIDEGMKQISDKLVSQLEDFGVTDAPAPKPLRKLSRVEPKDEAA
jgi:hypothetical protein